MEPPPPEVLALIVADASYRDDVSGKLSILGMSSRIGAATFPYGPRRMAVHVALVEGRGTVHLRIRIIDSEEERDALAEDEIEVTFPDPLTELISVSTLDDVVFPDPGEYRVQLYADGRFLRERRITLIPLENPGGL